MTLVSSCCLGMGNVIQDAFAGLFRQCIYVLHYCLSKPLRVFRLCKNVRDTLQRTQLETWPNVYNHSEDSFALP